MWLPLVKIGKLYALPFSSRRWRYIPICKQEKNMKKVVVTITAVVFALGLAGAGLAQTATKTEKPAVKTEAPAAPATVAPKEAAKPGEKAEAGTKGEVKATEKGKTKKEAKKVAKKEAKQGKEAKKPSVVEPSKGEKK
jgi:hypothetical protein